jgi:AcrR family transcriptional regulator
VPDESNLRSDAARNRGRLLEVAREQLRCDGSVPPLKVVAQLAGVGTGTAYRHFPTPEMLMAALGDDGLARLLTRTQEAADDADPVAGFERMLADVLDGLRRDPCVAAALGAPDNGCGPASSATVQLGGAVATLLERARTAGSIRPEVGADDIRRLLIGLAAGLRGVEDDDRAALHLRVLLDGLRP